MIKKYKKIKDSRRVTVCKWVPKKKGNQKGRSVALWAFSLLDLATALNVSIRTLQRLIKDNVIDPTNLSSVVAYVQSINDKPPSIPSK